MEKRNPQKGFLLITCSFICYFRWPFHISAPILLVPLQASKFDKDCPRIEELLRLGLSARKIAKVLGYSNHIGLNTYISKRKLRQSLG
jgi:hypothetical protein